MCLRIAAKHHGLSTSGSTVIDSEADARTEVAAKPALELCHLRRQQRAGVGEVT